MKLIFDFIQILNKKHSNSKSNDEEDSEFLIQPEESMDQSFLDGVNNVLINSI